MVSAMWRKAETMAAATPADRNRYVDLLRAFSIAVVVFGHWLMAAPGYQNQTPSLDHLFSVLPWTQWLTWIFQVMPVFFFVGGFSNGVSWDGAQRKQQSYSVWLEARLRRLLGPTVPLVLLWSVLGVIAFLTQVPEQMTKIGSQVSLVPVWFLAIYFFIVMLVPVSRALWHRFGFWSVSVPIVLAGVGDWFFFNVNQNGIAWLNYLFLWGAVHQLGYAWQQGRLNNKLALASLAAIAIASLVYLTHAGPYPLSLVGHPGQDISNNTPPKLPLVALGLAQISLLLLVEGPMRRWLSKAKVWTSTVLINGLIMPIFLWHSTVMMLLIGLGFLVWPQVFAVEIGSSTWWWLRPMWIVVYLTVLLLSLPFFMWLEKLLSATPERETPLWLTLAAGICICAGLAMLAGGGVVGSANLNLNWFGLNWIALGLPALGVALLSGLGRMLAKPLGSQG